ncbi:MAG: hypothetical protein QXH67_00275 [Candidatus Bathyarchaeia archaeon]
MSILIRELKGRLRELEERHRSLPLAVIETELERRPVYLSISGEGYQDLPRLFRGTYLRAYVVEDEFVISGLPRIRFDSSTFSKIEEVAYTLIGVDGIRDTPRIPHYKPDSPSSYGLELVKDGRVIATLLDSKFYISRDYEGAEELADALVQRVYRVEERPSLIAILISRLIRLLRRGQKRRDEKSGSTSAG